MAIKKIRIRNFRSILADEFEPRDLNLIVGPNDAGKSNYLRALNLFFNNNTEANTQPNWKVDYSFHAKKQNRKAEEIYISITFEPPGSFTSRELINWTKTWRRDSPLPYLSEKRTESGQQLGPRQKVNAWLERTKFKYVPAIKGPEYFRALLRDLHDTLALTIDKELRAASEEFLASLRQATSGLSNEVKTGLGLESKLQLPGSLGNFFEVLDFETTSKSGPAISLQQRGDGIKVRHIPAILKFLADQESLLAAKGKPRVTTIWGYEEPENNLELMAAFEAARHFKAYSTEIQTFLTTHSPAFYSLAGDDAEAIKAWYVSQPGVGTELELQTPSDLSAVDESMGLMQLVAPHVARAEVELTAVRTALASANAASKPVIFVGGSTDKMYLAKAIRVRRDAELLAQLEIEFIGIPRSGGDEFAGDGALKSTCSFLRSNPSYSLRKTLVLFDCDAKHVAQSFGKVQTFGIPENLLNTKIKRGIENLLPESAFLPNDYITKTSISEYGEEKSIQAFQKVKAAERICALTDGESSTVDLFSEFETVLHVIDIWIADSN